MPKPSYSYVEQLLRDLDGIERDYLTIIAKSTIVNIHPNRGGDAGVMFIGFPHWGWQLDDRLQSERMALLETVRLFRPRFMLLFPHATPELEKRCTKALDLLERWLHRKRDKTVPRSTELAATMLGEAIATLRAATEHLPDSDYDTHLIVDTNVLLDDPDLARFAPIAGKSYLVHLLPIVLRELDDHKRAGRNPELREAARKVDRRLKGLRDNGDISTGAKVAGDVWVKFEYAEPKAKLLPSWLDLHVPDDRLIASAMQLASQHARARTMVVTGDINLQTKLSAAGVAYVDPEV